MKEEDKMTEKRSKKKEKNKYQVEWKVKILFGARIQSNLFSFQTAKGLQEGEEQRK